MSDIAGCPFHSRALPGDGTPLTASPQIADWRDHSAFMPLDFQDGHEGLVATRYDAAVAVLQDPRFSMFPSRMPVGPDGIADADAAAVPLELPGDLDEAAEASDRLNLLNLDGEEHSKLRRAVTARFSVRQARAREPWIREMVAEQIEELRHKEGVVDLWRDFAMPISARTHCHVIGIPPRLYPTFVELFVEASTAQQKYDFIRALLEERADDPGEDVITDLLANDELDRVEIEGLLRLLMGAGRDSVAYLIATASVAADPAQGDAGAEGGPELADALGVGVVARGHGRVQLIEQLLQPGGAQAGAVPGRQRGADEVGEELAGIEPNFGRLVEEERGRQHARSGVRVVQINLGRRVGG